MHVVVIAVICAVGMAAWAGVALKVASAIRSSPDPRSLETNGDYPTFFHDNGFHGGLMAGHDGSLHLGGSHHHHGGTGHGGFDGGFGGFGRGHSGGGHSGGGFL